MINHNTILDHNAVIQALRRHAAPTPRPARQAIPANISALLERSVESFRPVSKTRKSTAKPKTHIAFVLDCSSSMSLGKGQTIEGFNKQLEVIKGAAADVGATFFTDVRFGDTVDVRSVAAPLASQLALNDETYQPDGCTALDDGIGKTIEALLSTPDIEGDNTATLVTVFTDGAENSSVTYSSEDIRGLIERLEATGRWTFALVGPNQSVKHMANQYSFSSGNIAGYDVNSSDDRARAFGDIAGASGTYMEMRSSGLTASASLYSAPGKQ